MNTLTQESREAIAARKANERFARERALYRYMLDQEDKKHRMERNKFLLAFAIMALAGSGIAATFESPTAKAGPIMAKSELTRQQIAALNVMPVKAEKKHALR